MICLVSVRSSYGFLSSYRGKLVKMESWSSASSGYVGYEGERSWVRDETRESGMFLSGLWYFYFFFECGANLDHRSDELEWESEGY